MDIDSLPKFHLEEESVDSVRQVAQATKFCTVAPNMWGVISMETAACQNSEISEVVPRYLEKFVEP